LRSSSGTDPTEGLLQDQVRRLGIGHAVRFLGARDDVAALLPVADLFVHPTLSDVLPTAVMEAMATGLAVVASRTGGLPELVDDGVTGRLVPPSDPSALAHVVGELLSNPGDRDRMGDAGRRRVELDLTLSAQVSGLDRLYRSVLDPPTNGVRR
jgi:glycosyltransferase involved in cell wall biosynthesis